MAALTPPEPHSTSMALTPFRKRAQNHTYPSLSSNTPRRSLEPPAGVTPLPPPGVAPPPVLAPAKATPPPVGISRKRNVVIIGQSGAGKSSLINMLCPGAKAPTSNDTIGCTQREQVYECDLWGLRCQVHDTVGLEEGRWGFLPLKMAQKRLKFYLNNMLKKNPKELDLLVYCIPGARGLKKSQGRNFKVFKSLAKAGNIQVVVVVTHLEGYYGPLENWWLENRVTLENIGIPASTKHACVTTQPKDELEGTKRYLYDKSYNDVKSLIRDNLSSRYRWRI